MKILFAGNGRAGKECLEFLLARDNPVVGVMTKTLGDIANEHNIPIVLPCVEDIEPLGADMLYSVYYHKRVPKDVLDMMKYAINLHGGRLPEYKGCKSNIWAIINDDDRSGVTMHTMTEEFDEGTIVDKKYVPITNEDTGESLYEKTTDAAVKLFKKFVPRFEKNGFLYAEPITSGRYYNKALPNNGEIDWSQLPRDIYNFIRALYHPPFEPAHTMVDGKKLYVYRAILDNDYVVITDARFEMIK